MYSSVSLGSVSLGSHLLLAVQGSQDLKHTGVYNYHTHLCASLQGSCLDQEGGGAGPSS